MPLIFHEGGFRFHFFSREGTPLEPVHVHVARPDADVKLWLYPVIRIAYNRGMRARELREVEEIVIRRRQDIEDAWNSFFGLGDQR